MSLRDTVEAEVRAWYDAYVGTFVGLARGERTDTEALLGFYGAPMVVVSDGDHKVLPTRAATLEFATGTIDALTRAGYTGSEISHLTVHAVATGAAFIEGEFSRHGREGREFGAGTGAYLAVRTAEGWRFASFISNTRL
ncbi:hypothetical protein ABZ883_04450 [Streptomyces sp. NPDC046977]|uniref:DUF6841 family protein n=1 Tax=Streptomyces sp. NPDC046977 TaxID=3154703 RepID=UPI0033EE8F95